MRRDLWAGVLMFALTATNAWADDTVKLAIGQRGNWDTSISEIGQRVGLFKKHGLVLEMVEHGIDHPVAQPPHFLELEPERVGRVGQRLDPLWPVSRHRT